MVKVTITQARKPSDSSQTFEINDNGNNILIDNQPFHCDVSELDANTYHVLHKNKSYRISILEKDRERKFLALRVNRNIYEISYMDKMDLLLEKLGMKEAVAMNAQDVRAPMPGLILDVKVKEGDKVKSGDPLVVLEAMKMENIIKAPGSGEVKSIAVKA